LLERPARTSRGVDLTAGRCVPTRPVGYRVTHSASRALFPSPATVPRTDRPPNLANRLHSLVPYLPFGVSSSVLLAAPFGAAVLPGFRPSSRHHRWRPRLRVFPTSRYVPSPGFLNLSTVFATLGFAGLLHPAATSRVRRSGVSPAPQPPRLVAGACPRAVARPRPHRRTGCHPRTPRLRGLAPWTDAFLRKGG